MLGNDILHQHIAARNRRRNHVGACLNLVGNDGILRALQFGNALNTNHICPCALDICPHHVQIVCSIYHMRLLCRVFNRCGALRHGCRKHDIDGRANAHLIHVDGSTNQLFGISLHHAVLLNDGCTKRTEALQVQVNGAFAKIAAAGHCHLCLFIACQKRTNEIIGCAHFLHALKGRLIADTLVTINFQSMFI